MIYSFVCFNLNIANLTLIGKITTINYILYMLRQWSVDVSFGRWQHIPHPCIKNWRLRPKFMHPWISYIGLLMKLNYFKQWWSWNPFTESVWRIRWLITSIALFLFQVHELGLCPQASEHATPMPVALIVKVKIIYNNF